MDLPKFDDMFKQINKNLQYSGIPYLGPLNWKFYVSFFIISLMLVMEISFFVSKASAENFLELTALAPCLGIGALSALKIKHIVSKRKEIYDLKRELKKMYNMILTDAEKAAIIAPTIKNVDKFINYFFVLNVVLISIFNFSSLIIMSLVYFSKGKVVYDLPFSVLVPFSTDSWYTWLIVYVQSISSGFICVAYYTAVDCLYYNLSSHVCINFKLLSHDIKQLKTSNLQAIHDIIRRHQYLIRLAGDLDKIFSLPNFYNVFFGSIEICALGFNIMTADWTTLPGFIVFILSELVQIFVMSVFGENLLSESMGVGNSLFLCDWYTMDKKALKLILIILIRTSKPQQLTAYKFSTISYQSFTKIISTSWSYFTILRTVYYSSDNQ